MMRNLLLIVLATFASCDRSYTPKPSGYLKVHYPEKEYVRFDAAAPYTFEYPAYAEVRPHTSRSAEPWWYDIRFPEYNGTIHLSYKDPAGDPSELIEDTRTLVYKHASRADGINEIPFADTANDKYGILYELSGNVASAVQFFLTDSTTHFLRGSLYFSTTPNRDSLNPVINFVQDDIVHLVESVRWRNND
jgi:gliding motility-associated lipoprotein GldD